MYSSLHTDSKRAASEVFANQGAVCRIVPKNTYTCVAIATK